MFHNKELSLQFKFVLMISRRLVRVKVLQSLYAWNRTTDVQDVNPFKSDLLDRIDQTHEMYLFLLDLPYVLQNYALEKKEKEQSKFYPDSAKVRKFSLLEGTALAKKIHEQLLIQSTNSRFDWNELESSFGEWYNQLYEWDFAQDYGIFLEPNTQQQHEFIESLFYVFLETHEAFNNLLEEIYPAWTSDSQFIVKELAKTINAFPEDIKVSISKPTTQKSEEVLLAVRLLEETIENSEKYDSLIASVTQNWDPSRIATMDLLIIKLALTEFLYCPEIPLKVTINEYLEITKDYSSQNSSKFVNGIMDKLRIDLSNKGEIHKSGRGLK